MAGPLHLPGRHLALALVGSIAEWRFDALDPQINLCDRLLISHEGSVWAARATSKARPTRHLT